MRKISGGAVRSGTRGVQGGCDRRIDVIVKMQKNRWRSGGVRSGGGGAGQAGWNRRIEVIVKMQKQSGGCRGSVVGGGGWSGVGWGLVRGRGWLVARLRVGGDVGYVGCEPRIEGVVQCT